MWDQIKASYEVPEVVDKSLSEFSRFAIYTPQTDFLRGRQAGRINTPPIGLHGEGLPEAVKSFLNHLHRSIRNSRRPVATDLDRAEAEIIKRSIDLVWLPGWAEQVRVDRLILYLPPVI